MEFKLHNGSGGLCCKSCGRQDKQLNTYDWLADIPGNAEESDMVEVQFKNTRKGYFRNSNKIPLEKGDIVAVEATPGHDIGVVTLTGRLVPLQMRKANIKSEADIKRIYRKAKPVDMDKYNEAKAREHSTMIRARQIALDLNLNMKIGDVEELTGSSSFTKYEVQDLGSYMDMDMKMGEMNIRNIQLLFSEIRLKGSFTKVGLTFEKDAGYHLEIKHNKSLKMGLPDGMELEQKSASERNMTVSSKFVGNPKYTGEVLLELSNGSLYIQ